MRDTKKPKPCNSKHFIELGKVCGRLRDWDMEKVDIYLEIACLQNPGPAGWGVVVSGEKGLLVIIDTN